MNFDVQGARKAGYSDAEIANHLASQSKFDAGAARKSGYSDTEIIGHLSGAKASRGYQKARANIERRQNVTRENNERFGAPGNAMNMLGDLNEQVARKSGLFDDLAGGIESTMQGGKNLLSRATGRPIETSMAEAGQAARDYEREKERRYAQEHPTGNMLANAASFVTMARPTGAAMLRNPIAAGGAAAVQNAPFAVGRQDGSLRERAPGAAAETALSFGLGAGGQRVGNALANRATAARARAPSAARRLSQEGVELTPGQMMGGVARRAEDAATSVPILGDAIRGARVRGMESFDRAAINRTLAPVNAQLAPNANVGRQGVQAATQEISNAYNTALRGVNVAPDQQYAAELAAIEQTPNLTAAQREQLTAVLGDLRGRFGEPIPGDLWKVIDSDLGKAIRAADHASQQAPGGRALTQALGRLQTAHNDLLMRTSQQAHAGVQAADDATANLARVRQASQYTGTSARDGVFSPADLNRAVQGMDTSAGNRNFATGQARMQDLSEAGMQVLPQQVPDSGTPFRSLMTVGGLSGGGVSLGANPEMVLAGLAGLAGASAMYSRPAMSLANHIYRATNPGQAAQALSQLATLAGRDPALIPFYERVAMDLGVSPVPVGAAQ